MQTRVQQSPAMLKGVTVGMRVTPNPISGVFVVELHVAANLNAGAKMELINMMGQSVQTETLGISNGILQQTLTFSPSLTRGLYLVRVTIKNNTYLAKLLYM